MPTGYTADVQSGKVTTFPHIRHALAPFRPFLTTETFGQPGSGLLLALALGALLLLWLLGVV